MICFPRLALEGRTRKELMDISKAFSFTVELLAAVAVAIGTRAATETVGGYAWTYRINGGTAEIML